MKYTVQSTKYVLKNWIYLLPFVLLPAFFLSVSTDQKAIANVVKALFDGKINDWTFVEIFRAISVLSFSTWKSIVFGLVCVIVLVPCVAFIMAFLEKHMRIGKRTFHGLWGKLNDNVVSTFGCVFLLLAIYELWTLILAAALFFLSRISISPLAYALCVCVYLLFHAGLMMAVSAIYLWLPCMQITGFRVFEAWLYSYNLMSKIKLRIIATQLIVLLTVEAGIAALAWYLSAGLPFTLIVAAVYALLLMIFCVRMQVAYFDRDQIIRADLKKYYQK